MSSFSAVFTFAGKKFEVLSCSYSFGQATDDKGRPASGVHAGLISLQIRVPDDDSLMGWMIDPYKKDSGSVVFNKTDQDSKMKELKFEDAYLVSYSESFHSESASPMTASLSISARKFTIGGLTHEVMWDGSAK